MKYPRTLALSGLLAVAGCQPSVTPFSNDTSNAVNALAADAENWVVLINADNDPMLQVGIMDATRILSFKDNTRLAELEAYFAPYDARRKVVFTIEYDCTQARSRLISTTAMGKIATNATPEWETYAAGHAYETIRRFVCMDPKARGGIGKFPMRMKGTADEIAQLLFQRFAHAPRLDLESDPFRRSD